MVAGSFEEKAKNGRVTPVMRFETVMVGSTAASPSMLDRTYIRATAPDALSGVELEALSPP